MMDNETEIQNENPHDAMVSDEFERFNSAIEALYIPKNRSGRVKFAQAWPSVALRLFGEKLIEYDTEGSGENDHIKELEAKAEALQAEWLQIFSEIHKKGVESGVLQIEYLKPILESLGREISNLVVSQSITDRVLGKSAAPQNPEQNSSQDKEPRTARQPESETETAAEEHLEKQSPSNPPSPIQEDHLAIDTATAASGTQSAPPPEALSAKEPVDELEDGPQEKPQPEIIASSKTTLYAQTPEGHEENTAAQEITEAAIDTIAEDMAEPAEPIEPAKPPAPDTDPQNIEQPETDHAQVQPSPAEPQNSEAPKDAGPPEDVEPPKAPKDVEDTKDNEETESAETMAALEALDKLVSLEDMPFPEDSMVPPVRLKKFTFNHEKEPASDDTTSSKEDRPAADKTRQTGA